MDNTQEQLNNTQQGRGKLFVPKMRAALNIVFSGDEDIKLFSDFHALVQQYGGSKNKIVKDLVHSWVSWRQAQLAKSPIPHHKTVYNLKLADLEKLDNPQTPS